MLYCIDFFFEWIFVDYVFNYCYFVIIKKYKQNIEKIINKSKWYFIIEM